ncbi:M23 family metallopeptidase [Antrihabitans cavernicola]|nr:M23 family metallopeptidase [Spelaeibacter cavernicola]
MNTSSNRATRRRMPVGRIAAASVAAGAVVAAAAGASHSVSSEQPDLQAAGHTAAAAAPVSAPVALEDPAAKAARDAELVARDHERLAREADALRPKVVIPVIGPVSSLFGARWGEFHAGMDFADPIGTPIAAVTDGTIIEAGPAQGFGLWVRVQQDDGTIGVFGHVNDILATVGQHVRAGDIIATVGNRGQSTGPHLHYEVWAVDGQKIDPLPWLISRGLHPNTAMAS